MNHLTEEELILHYYGEESDACAATDHLDGCSECRATYGGLQRILNVVDALPIPERGPEYGDEVWNRIERHMEHRLATRPYLWEALWWAGRRAAPLWRWGAAAAAFASLLVAAFLAGRHYPAPQRVPIAAADPQAGERILLVAVGDYLERSQMVLVELANASPKGALDISDAQERALDLVSENRLYRQTAARTGDAAVASLLDELERVLLDIAHAPSRMSPQELETLRQRFESGGILFKIRVLGWDVRNRQERSSPEARQKL
jgi:hypothetical protein